MRGRKPKKISDNNEIQKCRPLFYDLWKEKDAISMTEYKLLDIYMSAINSHDINTREVLFESNHLNETLGTGYTREDIQKIFKKMMQLVVKADKNILVSLFEATYIQQNEKNEFQVLLKCTESAQKYFFNLDNIGYFSYKLKSTLAIGSVYSYLMFNYIEMNRFRKSWEVSVDDLKQYLNCTTEETYKQFKRFNDLVLKKCLNELTEKTELKYSYETVKSGRYVQAIKFTILDDVAERIEQRALEIKKQLESEKKQIKVIETSQNENTFTHEIEEQSNNHSNNNDKFTKCFDDFMIDIFKERVKENLFVFDIEEEKYINTVFDRAVAKLDMLMKRTPIHQNALVSYFEKILDTECKKFVEYMQSVKPKPQERKEQSYDIDEFEKFAITFSKNTKKRE